MPYTLALLCSLLFFFSPPLHAADKSSTTQGPLSIGIHPYLSTRTLLELHDPLARSLETQLTRTVTLRTAPDYPSFFKRMREGAYDLVIAPPHFGWLAIKDMNYQPVLVHKEPIRALLITAQKTPLRGFDDLRGQTIAVTDRSALMAILTTVILNDQGLKEGLDYHFQSAVSHSSAIHNAVSGKTRAALINATSLQVAPEEIRQQTLIWREMVRFPGQFVVAHPRIAATDLNSIQLALQAFEQSPAGQGFFRNTNQGGYRTFSIEDQKQLDRALPETRRLLSEIRTP
jgi:phosphonate transport system substrate-binding protein